MGAKTHHVSAHRVGTLLLRAMLLTSAADGSVRAQLTPGSIGQPDCRCVDASSALTPLINDWSVNNCMNHTVCTANPGNCFQTVSQDAQVVGTDGLNGFQASYCYSSDYGSSACGSWDMHVGICADNMGNPLADAPSWCRSNWCYVDSVACKDSEYTVTRSLMFPHIFFSYETCGSPAHSVEDLGASLNGRVLRAGMPVPYYPLLYKYSEERTNSEPQLYQDDSAPWSGIMPNYVQEIVMTSRQSAGVMGQGILGINYTYVSHAARTKVPGSSYSACIEDVYNGVVDFCAADFWMTAQRLQRVPFTVPMHMQLIELFVPQTLIQDPSLIAMMGAVFRPFEISVWILICILAILVGILDMWLNSRNWREKVDAARKKGGAPAARMKTFSVGLRYVYQGGFAFVNGGAENEEDSSWPSRVLKLGWAFFIVIALGSYTANLAAFLQGERVPVKAWQSMEDAAAAGKVVCSYLALESEMKSMYPDTIMRSYTDTMGILKAYNNGECDGFVAIVDEFDINQGNYDQLCKTSMRSTGSVLEVPVGMPARSSIVAGLSTYMGLMRRSSKTMSSPFMSAYKVASNCTYTQQTTEGGQRGETTPLGILNFSGTIALMLLSSFAAITAKVVFGEENHMENIQRLTHNIRETALYTADPLVGGIRFLQNKRRASFIGARAELTKTVSDIGEVDFFKPNKAKHNRGQPWAEQSATDLAAPDLYDAGELPTPDGLSASSTKHLANEPISEEDPLPWERMAHRQKSNQRFGGVTTISHEPANDDSRGGAEWDRL